LDLLNDFSSKNLIWQIMPLVTMECMPSRISSTTAGNKFENNKDCSVKSLNLASNMISGEGLELFLDDLIANTQLRHLDIGVVEGSMRKNSLGI
jgi:hypothetical protein